MENYLFLGGAGFIGSNIIWTMIGQRTAMQPEPADSACPFITVLEPPHADTSRLMHSNVNIVRGTLQDTELIERLIRDNHITTVIHLVSTMTPASTYEDYLEELYTVARPTIRLMELCAHMGVRLVYFSSGGAIYGESDGGKPFRESDPLNPISYYGQSKSLIEANIRFEHRVNGLRYLIFRPSNPFGPGQNIYGRQGLIAVAIGNIVTGQPVTVWGDGTAVRDYIYIDDLAKSVCAIMRSCAENEVINIGSGEGMTVKDVIGYINDVVAYHVDVQYRNNRKSDVRSSVLDVTRMKQIYTLPLTGTRKGIQLFYGEVKQALNGKS